MVHVPNFLFTAIEYVDESKRTLVGNIGLALALTVSGVYQPWLVKTLGDWKVFNWILFAQMALVIATPLIMPESCRYSVKKSFWTRCFEGVSGG